MPTERTDKSQTARVAGANAPLGRLGKLAIVLAGIVAGQVVLYGPSLAGRKILLPLDHLSQPRVYIPRTPEVARIVEHDPVLSDLILLLEPARRFAASELRAGRFPLWVPYQYAGAPFVYWQKFSPLMLLSCLAESPIILAWIQMLSAAIAGFGMYLFCRRALATAFWPSAVVAWCYPLTGFFVFWQGYSTSQAVIWLPWLLLTVDKAVRRPGPAAATALSATTCLVLVSGQLDVAAQVLLVSGLYAAWRHADAYPKNRIRRRAGQAVLAVAAGWGMGLFLAAPHVLPVLEYAQTSARMVRRGANAEERPPVGFSALPQAVLPDMYGATRKGSARIAAGNQIESSAAAYAGIFATLFLAPLAWCGRRRRSGNLFWTLLAFGGLSWCVNSPLVAFLRLPGINMMSHNRLVFATSFSILALAAIGLDTLWRGRVERRWWSWLPAALLAGLSLWCLHRTRILPQQALWVKTERAVALGGSLGPFHDLDGLNQAKEWFIRRYAVAAVFCGLGAAGWLLLWFKRTWRPWALHASGLLLMADLLYFGYGRSAQSDPALNYPPIPVLESIAKSAPGRIIGYDCLPAALAQTQGLRDIRGYDAMDPARLMDLMKQAIAPRSTISPYAITQHAIPKVSESPTGEIRLSPLLDMLNVRYIIFRGAPPKGVKPDFQGFDYWARINRNALPRAFVPRRVEVAGDRDDRLRRLTSPQFDPREVAYVESPVELPARCRGSAKILTEIPTRITISVQMQTPGLVVLSDLWDKGWRATRNGKPAAVLRANHAVRGVVVPAGDSLLEFRYEPASLAWGLILSGLAAAVLLCGLGATAWKRR